MAIRTGQGMHLACPSIQPTVGHHALPSIKFLSAAVLCGFVAACGGDTERSTEPRTSTASSAQPQPLIVTAAAQEEAKDGHWPVLQVVANGEVMASLQINSTTARKYVIAAIPAQQEVTLQTTPANSRNTKPPVVILDGVRAGRHQWVVNTVSSAVNNATSSADIQSWVTTDMVQVLNGGPSRDTYASSTDDSPTPGGVTIDPPTEPSPPVIPPSTGVVLPSESYPTYSVKIQAGAASPGTGVTAGIPIRRKLVEDVADIAVLDANGMPYELDAIAWWPDGSVKVALLKMVADLGEEQTIRVRLTEGTGPSSGPTMGVSQGGDGSITVDGGTFKARFSPQGLLDAAWRDRNADGLYQASEQVILGASGGVVNAKNGQTYAIENADNAEVSVEETGRVRTIIKAKGQFTSDTGQTLANYQIRYYLYSGSDKVDVDITLIDDRLEQVVNQPQGDYALAIEDFSLHWDYANNNADAQYRFGGEGHATYAGAVDNGTHSLLQTGAFRFDAVNGVDNGHSFAYSGVGTGEKAPGWVQVDSTQANLGVMIHEFWQQFPGAISVSPSRLTASVFPAASIMGEPHVAPPPVTDAQGHYQRGNTLYFSRPGGAKTYRMRLHFPAQPLADEDLHALSDRYQQPGLDLVVEKSDLVNSQAFGLLGEGFIYPDSDTYSSNLMRTVYQPSFEAFGDGDSGGLATQFGWRDYGDRLRAGWSRTENIDGVSAKIPTFFNDTHVGANNFLKEYVRTGDVRWLELGRKSTWHFMDIDVSHGPRQGYWNTGGVPQPAGEVHALAHDNEDHQTRNLHRGHAHVSGLSDLYLLTGDKRAYDVLQEISGWMAFMTPYWYKLPFRFDDDYREAERDYGWPIYVLNEWVRVSGDAAYHRNYAAHAANYMVQWWKTPRPQVGYNPATGVISNEAFGMHDASQGTGWWTMTSSDNSYPYQGVTGTNPWMAGSLISNLLAVMHHEDQFVDAGNPANFDRAEYHDMLMQTMNHVVKQGWDADKKYFVYHETRRDIDGGGNHVFPALATMRYHYEVEERRHPEYFPHPEWYDTQPLWYMMERNAYVDINATMKTDTQSYGFYGYEMLFPVDFFLVQRGATRIIW